MNPPHLSHKTKGRCGSTYRWPYYTGGHIAWVATLHMWPYCMGGLVAHRREAVDLCAPPHPLRPNGAEEHICHSVACGSVMLHVACVHRGSHRQIDRAAPGTASHLRCRMHHRSGCSRPHCCCHFHRCSLLRYSPHPRLKCAPPAAKTACSTAVFGGWWTCAEAVDDGPEFPGVVEVVVDVEVAEVAVLVVLLGRYDTSSGSFEISVRRFSP